MKLQRTFVLIYTTERRVQGNIAQKNMQDMLQLKILGHDENLSKIARKKYVRTAMKFTDLYPGAKSTCQEHYNGKRHESSPASKAIHRYRKDTRLKYRILFGKSKYVHTSAKKSA